MIAKIVANQIPIKKALIALLLTDIFFITLHLIFGLGFNMYLFHIDIEKNIPTIYQSMKLMGFGFLFLSLFAYGFLPKLKNKWNQSKVVFFWTFSSAMFIFLGVDEVSQIHEEFPEAVRNSYPAFASAYESLFQSLGHANLGWAFYYAPFMLIAIVVMVWQLFILKKESINSIYFLVLGVLLIVLVPFMEVWNMSGSLNDNQFQVAVTLEESFEMFGMSFIAYAYFLYFIKTLSKSESYKKLLKNT